MTKSILPILIPLAVSCAPVPEGIEQSSNRADADLGEIGSVRVINGLAEDVWIQFGYEDVLESWDDGAAYGAGEQVLAGATVHVAHDPAASFFILSTASFEPVNGDGVDLRLDGDVLEILIQSAEALPAECGAAPECNPEDVPDPQQEEPLPEDEWMPQDDETPGDGDWPEDDWGGEGEGESPGDDAGNTCTGPYGESWAYDGYCDEADEYGNCPEGYDWCCEPGTDSWDCDSPFNQEMGGGGNPPQVGPMYEGSATGNSTTTASWSQWWDLDGNDNSRLRYTMKSQAQDAAWNAHKGTQTYADRLAACRNAGGTSLYIATTSCSYWPGSGGTTHAKCTWTYRCLRLGGR